MMHRFDGPTCQCGRRHRLRSRGQLPKRQPRPPSKTKAGTGPVKATPALVRYLREAISIARSEGDNHLRTDHVMRALGMILP